MLSEVIPSKLLKSKHSLSSSSISSQQSSSRAYTNVLKKDISSPPAEGSKNIFRKLKRKSKSKDKKDEYDNEEEDSSRIEITEIMDRNDYEDWQLNEEAIADKDHENVEIIDREVEPVFSDIEVQSSLEGGNSTMDEYENNEKILKDAEDERQMYADIEQVMKQFKVGSKKIVKNNRVENVLCRKEGSINLNAMLEVKNEDREKTKTRKNQESDQNKDRIENVIVDIENNPKDEDMSDGSLKTFRKTEEDDNNGDNVKKHEKSEEIKQCDNLDIKTGEELKNKEEINSSTEDLQTLIDYEVQSGDAKGDYDRSNTFSCLPEIPIKRPKKCHSMPNISDITVKDSSMYRKIRISKHDEDSIDRLLTNNQKKNIGIIVHS